MKKLITLLLALGLCRVAYATDVSGPVSGTWTLANSPYVVIGETWVPIIRTLVIEPGVEVIALTSLNITIYGRILAMGTVSDSITFTAGNTIAGWRGLRFYFIDGQPDSSRLIYCRFDQGKSLSSWLEVETKHGGVLFCKNSSKLVIQNCLFTNNKTADIIGQNGGMGTGSPGYSASSGHGGAIYLINSNPIIMENTFYMNRTGRAQGGDGGSGVTNISSTQFYVLGGNGGNGGAGYAGYGGALYGTDSAPTIIGNVFRENCTSYGRGGDGGAGGIADLVNPEQAAIGGNGGYGGRGIGGHGGAIFLKDSTATQCTIQNNLFYKNHTGSGYGGNGGIFGECWVWGGVIPNEGEGGNGGAGQGGNGACFYFFVQPAPIVIGNTITRNWWSEGFGGARGLGGTYSSQPGNPGISLDGEAIIYCTIIATPQIRNTIIWGNRGPIMINGYASANYSCIEGGYPGIGNITEPPLFVPGPFGDFYLSQIAAGQTQQSPCVDHGDPATTMFIGTTRSDGVQDSDVIDIGYHYHLGNSPTTLTTGAITPRQDPMSGICNFGLYPNPANPHTLVKYELKTAGWVKLEVYDIAGRLNAILVDSWQEAGDYEAAFDGSNWSSGIYFYRLQAGAYIATGKMVLLK